MLDSLTEIVYITIGMCGLISIL